MLFGAATWKIKIEKLNYYKGSQFLKIVLVHLRKFSRECLSLK